RRRLDALSVREGVQIVELSPLSDVDAARLVRQAIPGAHLEPSALADLVRLCDRLPLALRIAAARLSGRTTRTLAMLVDELNDEQRRLSALALPAGDAAVRTAFEASFADLSPEARNLWCA